MHGLAALIVSLRMLSSSFSDEPPPRYRPATTDYGKLVAAWEYQGSWPSKVPSDLKLVAAEIELPPPSSGSFDLDDIDIFDADSGEWFGSDPVAQRLTPTGEFVAQDDPEFKDQGAYRGIFIWAVGRNVRRVNFGYWGEMLFKNPVALRPTGRVLPPGPTAVVEAIGPFGSAEGYERHLVLLHGRDWPRGNTPRSYSLYASDAKPKRDICDCDAWLEVDAAGRPVDRLVLARPYYEKDRYFLLDYWCPAGSSPDALNLFGEHTPLPRGPAPVVGPRTLERLAAAEKNLAARHRWISRK